jgi:WD40 repeat protein
VSAVNSFTRISCIVIAVIALVSCVHQVPRWIERSWDLSGDISPDDVILNVPDKQSDDHIIGVAVASDGRFATGTRGGKVTLRSATGELLLAWQAHEGPVAALSFLPDSSAVVSAGRNGSLRVWSLSAGGSLLRAAADGSGPVSSVAVSPDGQLLAVGSTGRVTVWRFGSDCLEPVGEFTAAPYAINALAFSADGRTLAAGNSGDGCAWVWRFGVSTKPELIDLSAEFQIRGLRFTGDGDSLVAMDTDGNVILAKSGEPARMVGHPTRGCVRQAAFSPDGRRVIISYVDGTARITTIRARAADR